MSLVTAATDPRPIDLETMRASVRRLLDPDAAPDVLPPPVEGVDTLTATLRGQLELLVPEIEQLAAKIDTESIPRYCALACVGEARGKLRATAEPGSHGAVVYARRLARALDALCDHYETLSAVRPEAGQ